MSDAPLELTRSGFLTSWVGLLTSAATAYIRELGDASLFLLKNLSDLGIGVPVKIATDDF